MEIYSYSYEELLERSETLKEEEDKEERKKVSTHITSIGYQTLHDIFEDWAIRGPSHHDSSWAIVGSKVRNLYQAVVVVGVVVVARVEIGTICCG